MSSSGASGCSIASDLTSDELTTIKEHLDRHNMAETGGRFRDPGVDFSVTVAGPDGVVVGGINVSTKLEVMFLEVLWVDDACRDRGLGGRVLLEAERLGREAGCIASQTWTFSFQAPVFYQKLGYHPIGLFDGYPDGITEHVLMKRLAPKPGDDMADPASLADGFTVVGNASKEAMQPVYDGFHEFCVAHLGDEEMENPGIKVPLALRDGSGRMVGGLYAWTTLRIVVPEVLWIDPAFRGAGWGRALMTEAEQIAGSHGCISSQTGAFTFQSPGFFEALGYRPYGESDAYPIPFSERYFVKML